jgi:hypothetical protein
LGKGDLGLRAEVVCFFPHARDLFHIALPPLAALGFALFPLPELLMGAADGVKLDEKHDVDQDERENAEGHKPL